MSELSPLNVNENQLFLSLTMYNNNLIHMHPNLKYSIYYKWIMDQIQSNPIQFNYIQYTYIFKGVNSLKYLIFIQ